MVSGAGVFMPRNAIPLTDEEFVLLRELLLAGAKFMVVGMGAAILQGADQATNDLDLWFESVSNPKVSEAARKAHGVFIWRSDLPMFAGKGIDHIDAVTHCDGLESFREEYKNALEIPFAGLILKVLPIDRVIASKVAAGRAKDKAVMPSLLAALAAIRKK